MLFAFHERIRVYQIPRVYRIYPLTKRRVYLCQVPYEKKKWRNRIFDLLDLYPTFDICNPSFKQWHRKEERRENKNKIEQFFGIFINLLTCLLVYFMNETSLLYTCLKKKKKNIPIFFLYSKNKQ